MGNGEMKWPEWLAVVRHDFSAYNALKAAKAGSVAYQEFKRALKELGPTNGIVYALAECAREELALDTGDHDTDLANGGDLAKAVGRSLRSEMELPDVVIVSPYLRTALTFKGLVYGWPELAGVKVYEEERIREQEHGLALLCNDRAIFEVLNPEQRALHAREGNYWYRFPQGENVPDVRERLRSWTTTLIREFSGKRVLAVTHHLCILALRANLERLSAQEFIALDQNEKPMNCGVTLYKGYPDEGKNGRLKLEYYNRKFY